MIIKIHAMELQIVLLYEHVTYDGFMLSHWYCML